MRSSGSGAGLDWRFIHFGLIAAHLIRFLRRYSHVEHLFTFWSTCLRHITLRTAGPSILCSIRNLMTTRETWKRSATQSFHEEPASRI